MCGEIGRLGKGFAALVTFVRLEEKGKPGMDQSERGSLLTFSPECVRRCVFSVLGLA